MMLHITLQYYNFKHFDTNEPSTALTKAYHGFNTIFKSLINRVRVIECRVVSDRCIL